MEKFQQAREKAVRNLNIADHMLYITYPLIKDNKLLMAITENIFLAVTNAMASVLYYERLFKKIPPFHETFDSKYNLFSEKIVPRYNIEKDYLKFLRSLKDIMMAHRESSVEFSRPEKYVICIEDYKTKTVTVNELKEMLAKAKNFVELCNKIVKKNEGIFRESK